MNAKKYAKTRAEADTERWYVNPIFEWGDVESHLDEPFAGDHSYLRRVSDWELFAAFDNEGCLCYIWRCRVVDVGGAE